MMSPYSARSPTLASVYRRILTDTSVRTVREEGIFFALDDAALDELVDGSEADLFEALFRRGGVLAEPIERAVLGDADEKERRSQPMQSGPDVLDGCSVFDKKSQCLSPPILFLLRDSLPSAISELTCSVSELWRLMEQQARPCKRISAREGQRPEESRLASFQVASVCGNIGEYGEQRITKWAGFGSRSR